MYISNSYLNLPNEETDLGKYPNFSEENEFISNLMLNPQKYREFKSNINRINNVENEISYLKSLEKNTQINFLDNIIISDEEFQKALKDEEIIFENLTEERINDLLSHKKLLSHEKHLMETMAYILGYESFDWNMLRKIINLFYLKTKMQNVDYSRIKKRRINLLLSQLCRTDKSNKFLKMNDFCDSGLEFIYEWVKTQLKIYFYLYQNKKINKLQNSQSMLNILKNNETNDNINNNDKSDEINGDMNYHKNKKTKDYSTQKMSEDNYSNINKTVDSNFDDNIKTNIKKRNTLNEKISNSSSIAQKLEKVDSYFIKNSTNIESFNNSKINNNNYNISNMTGNNRSTVINSNNNFINRNSSVNNVSSLVKNKSSLLLTSLPYIVNKTSQVQTNEQSTSINSYPKINQVNKWRYLKEAKKVSVKLRGFNKIKDNIIKEIRTAEMLPFLKNKTFPQMRNYFDEKLPFDKKIEQKAKMDINYLSINGAKDEKKMLWIIAQGKMKSFNLESLYKLKNMLKN